MGGEEAGGPGSPGCEEPRKLAEQVVGDNGRESPPATGRQGYLERAGCGVQLPATGGRRQPVI